MGSRVRGGLHALRDLGVLGEWKVRGELPEWGWDCLVSYMLVGGGFGIW